MDRPYVRVSSHAHIWIVHRITRIIRNMKVLCLADNTNAKAWGEKITNTYSKNNNLIYRGQVQDNQKEFEEGCYQVGPHTMSQKDIIEVTKYFDRIVLVDQKQSQFSHSRIFLAMWKLLKDMEEVGIKIKIENPKNMEYIDRWEEYFIKNKSFCANPWILMHDGMNGETNICGRNYNKIKQRKDIKDWQNDPDYGVIRKKMVNGEKVSGCEGCYMLEEKGARDMRWTDSFDWITRLELKSIDDFNSIKNPLYYEVRPSNKCNLKCRMCSSGFSHLIQEENKNITDKKFANLISKQFTDGIHIENGDSFEKIDFKNAVRVYIAGGEPTVMPEVYKFLRSCIHDGRTNLELNINTNAVKISEPLFDLFKQFTKLWFTCSMDGTGKVNEYQRWGTDTKKQIKNTHRLHNNGAGIHFIFVSSIYNIHNIGDAMHFFDEEFPYATIQINYASYHNDILSPFNRPDTELILSSLEKAKSSKCYYHQERGSKPLVDALYNHYSKDPKVDRQKLIDFFHYNDTLDQHRNAKLSDYIPELAECRKYI